MAELRSIAERPADPVIAIVGGGISGLAAAHHLAARCQARMVLLEASAHPGGKVRTQDVGDLRIEAGPDGFVADDGILTLCRELGLGSELVEAATTQAYHWGADGGLRPLTPPDMRHTGVRGQAPTRFFVLRNGLDRLIAALAQATPGLRVRSATAVTSLRRLNDGRLALGLSATGADGDIAPSSGAGTGPRTPNRPIASSTAGRAAGTAHVPDMTDGPSGTGAADLVADAAVVALPAREAAALLRDLAPDAAEALAGIPYLDLGVVTLVYPGRPWVLNGSGFLAAERPGRLMSGCTWLSEKWPHLALATQTVMRATTGGSGSRTWAAMSDDALAAAIHGELTDVLGPAPAPVATRVVRWREAIADHRFRDPARVARAHAALAGSHVALVAGGYTGGGLASCVAEAARAADAVVAELGPRLRRARGAEPPGPAGGRASADATQPAPDA